VSSEVPFFFKQWGGAMKSRTGRVLGGRTWDETPANSAHGPRAGGNARNAGLAVLS
jgi:hypothetical protein